MTTNEEKRIKDNEIFISLLKTKEQVNIYLNRELKNTQSEVIKNWCLSKLS